MSKSDVWLADATFKSSAKEFYQLFVLHCLYFNQRMPMIYVLMKQKNEESYDEVFKKISEFKVIGPKYYISDFEIAPLNSFKKYFTDFENFGCYFHWTQIIWKWVQKEKLVQKYKEKDELFLIIKRVLTLPFCHPNDVTKIFEQIELHAKKSILYQEIKVFFEFFKKSWLVENVTSRFRNITKWSVFMRILKEIPTTTNSLEAWHRHLNSRAIISKPNIYKGIELLRREENKTAIQVNNLFNGKKNVQCSNLKRQLFTIVSNYSHYEWNEYLDLLINKISWKLDD